MLSSLTVRRARTDDAPAMARVHVQAWEETYRGIIDDAVLDAPDALTRREQMWRAALTGPGAAADARRSFPAADAQHASRIAVAEHAGKIVGIASAGATQDSDATWDAELYVLYLLAAHHGSGAGSALLEAVLTAGTPASLWVLDPNPRAQAFYRKHGFAADGTVKPAGHANEIRMRRP